jgi:metal-dependent hydrolase (beta-lactamase superfamily II)
MNPNNKYDNAVEDSYLVTQTTAQSSKVLTGRCPEGIINVLLSNVSLIKSQPFASSNQANNTKYVIRYFVTNI